MKEFHDYQNIILSILDRIGDKFRNDTVFIIKELVEHNEIGISLEILCSQIFEYKIIISIEDKFKLRHIASELGISQAQLDGLG